MTIVVQALAIALLAAGAAEARAEGGLRGGIEAPDPHTELVGIVPELSRGLLDWNESPNGTSLKLLRGREAGTLRTGHAYVHGRAQAARMKEWTNEAGKFPYLGRFPFQHGGGEQGGETVVHRAQLATTIAMPWVTLFAEGFYSDTLYREDDRWDMRRATLTIGDLDRSPFYAKAGWDFVDFGHMGAYGPFLQSMNWHYFATQSDRPVVAVGYAGNGIEASATWIPGGRHTRVAASDDGAVNFALDAAYTRELRPGIEITIGGGYLHDTIYDTAIPHHDRALRDAQETVRNGAANIRGELTVGGFDLMGEFTRTLDDWPATNAPVSALTVQGRWRGSLRDMPLTLSAAYGLGQQGTGGEEWDKMEQYVLGAELELNTFARLQAEYVYNTGFAPLIAITRVSDASVKAHTLSLGATVGF